MEYSKSQDYQEKEREAAAIRKDILTARKYINDAITRYITVKIRARSKKQAEDLSAFRELDDYNSKRDIHDAYGWEFITEAQMDRLMEMWDAREKYIDDQGKFSDRVTQMLEWARDCCGEMFREVLEQFDEMQQNREETIREIEKRNAEIDYERYIAGLRCGNCDESA